MAWSIFAWSWACASDPRNNMEMTNATVFIDPLQTLLDGTPGGAGELCALLLQLAVPGRHQGPGRAAEEEDREAGVPRGVEPVGVLAPGAVGRLGVDQRGRPFRVPEVVADLLRAEQDRRALQSV